MDSRYEMMPSILSRVLWKRLTSIFAGTASARAISLSASSAAAFPFMHTTGFFALSRKAAAALSAFKAASVLFSPMR